MRTLASVIIDKKNEISPEDMGPWLWGWEVWRDSSQVVRYTNDVKSFTLAGLVFTRRAFSLIPPETNAGGGVFGWKVSIENTDRAISTFIEAGEMKGQPTALYRCHADHLDDLNKSVIWRARIIGVTADSENFSFSCGLYPLEGVQIPASKWIRTRCRHKYSAPGKPCPANIMVKVSRS